MTNYLEQINTFYHDILARGDHSKLPELVSEEYQSHVPALPDLPRFEKGIQALENRLKQSGPITNDIKRILVDGNLVLVHVRYLGSPDIAGADIFRFDGEGRITEHWLTRQAVPDDVTDDSMFDGGGNPQAELTPDKISANRRHLEEAYNIFFAQARHDMVNDFYAPCYRQHNPHMPDGSERLATMLKTKGPVVADVQHIIASGDLVAGHSIFRAEGLDNDRNAGDQTHAVDIFRIDENGLFAEHWDVLQMESNTLPNVSTLF